MKKQLICCSIAAALFAPASYSAMLEEVVVTAQKREQNLQDVGIAVSAFTGDQMAAMGVTQSVDIAAFTPGVHISGNLAGQNTQFSIRGVTQNDFNDVIEAPNAVYLDEGYLAIAQAQTFAVFDIERVEILKALCLAGTQRVVWFTMSLINPHSKLKGTLISVLVATTRRPTPTNTQ